MQDTVTPDAPSYGIAVNGVEMTTAELVTRRLLSHQFDTVFCLPGVQNDFLFDAFHTHRSTLRVIHTRHEQGAAYMALGAAMATGSPSIFNVVPGPGILNATAALSTAYAVNAPVLALTGQIPSSAIGKGFGVLHEIPDQLGVLRSLTKWAARIDQPQDAEARVDEAVWRLRSGRPRPVALECPIDVWPKRGRPAQSRFVGEVTEPALDDAQIAAAVRLLVGAKFPLIIVGSGAQDAAAEVTALAERLWAPVVAHRMGHGIVDARHPLCANVITGKTHWSQADVVVAIGTRLQFQQQQWGTDPRLSIIRIDIDPEEISRIKSPTVGIVGSARTVLRRVLESLPGGSDAQVQRGERIQSVRDKAAAEIAYLQPQISFLNAIRAELPESGIFVDELTQLGYVSRLAFPVYQPRTFLSPGYQGTLGWGLPVALGAKAARPDRAVVLVSGDGGFLFNVQELACAVQHRLAVAIVLVNDGAFGNVQRTQIEDFDGRVIASELVNPDFVGLARSFGAEGTRAQSPAALRTALQRAFAASVPTVIEVPAGHMPSPWPHLRFTRARPVQA